MQYLETAARARPYNQTFAHSADKIHKTEILNSKKNTLHKGLNIMLQF